MADKVTFWTEGKFTVLIEKVITRALDEQWKNLLNIILDIEEEVFKEHTEWREIRTTEVILQEQSFAEL